MPPAERPSTGVAARKGRERPRPHAVNAAPGPTGGVAHAQCQFRRCAGARVLCASKCCPRIRTNVSQHLLQQGTASLPRFCRGSPAGVAPNFPGVIASGFAVAPVADFPGARRAGQGSASPLRALDPPVALPMLLQLPERRHERFDSWLAHADLLQRFQTAPGT